MKITEVVNNLAIVCTFDKFVFMYQISIPKDFFQISCILIMLTFNIHENYFLSNVCMFFYLIIRVCKIIKNTPVISGGY